MQGKRGETNYYWTGDMARLFGVTIETIKTWLSNGKLPADLLIPGLCVKRKFDKAKVDLFLEKINRRSA